MSQNKKIIELIKAHSEGGAIKGDIASVSVISKENYEIFETRFFKIDKEQVRVECKKLIDLEKYVK